MKHNVLAQAKHYYRTLHHAVEVADKRVIKEREERDQQGAKLMQWVKTEARHANPWQVLENNIARLTTGDLCDEAVLVLLNEAGEQASRHKQIVPELRKMADIITSAAKVRIDSYQEIARGNQKARKKTALPSNLRPAEIYRCFAKPLRWLRDQGDVKAAMVLRELMAEQTMPFEELGSPSWIDPYTKTVDPSADRPGDIRVRITEPVLDSEIAVKMEQDLGWDEKTVRDFLAAQEGFNAEDGLEFLMDAVDENALGRLDDRAPLWMEMQGDCHPTKEIGIIRSEGKPYLKACRDLIDRLVKEANADIDMADRFWRTKVFKHVKDGFAKSQEAADYMSFLQDKAEEGAATADIAVMFLALQHAYGFAESAAEEIRLRDVPNFRTLGEWMDFWGDELLDAMNDSPWRWKEMSTEEIGAYSDQAVAEMLAKHDHATSDVFRTQAFMAGYLNCMINGNIVTRVDKGKKHNLAVEAGWESYRQWKSPAGSILFHQLRSDGKEYKEAMSAFWGAVRKHEKRVATGTVVNPKENGLVLNTGRLIDWRIALIKLRNEELYFPGNTRERIKAALMDRGIGLEFAAAL